MIADTRGRRTDRSQLGRWRRAGKFPAPWFEVGATPVWRRETIEQWAATYVADGEVAA